MPKLYTLFTAINDYQHVRKLTGCINDANNLKTYIQEAAKAQKLEVVPWELYDIDATKDNIHDKFLSHLGQASKNDICLFYFAGHGGQETANEAFLRHESDGKLEVLACYDSDLKHQGTFLADKELRYLIRELYENTAAQIVTIFDCCHAGTNTRSLKVIRRLMDDADSRNWDGFIFKDELTAEKVAATFDLETILPQGKHIHLAACEAHQEAQELVDEGGVFTSNLVNILEQAKGKISYHSLVSAIRKKIRPSYKQNPQAFARGDQKLLFQSFLGGITSHQRMEADLVFNKSPRGWVLELGALDGIKKNNSDLVLEILDDTQKSIGEVEMTEVLLDKTFVEVPRELDLDTKTIYKVKVSGLIVDKLRVFPIGAKEGVANIIKYFKENQQKIEGVQLVENAALADYLIVVENKRLRICLPFNHLMVTESIQGYATQSLDTLTSYLEQIAYWTFIKNLENEEATKTEQLPVNLEAFVMDESGKNETPLTIEKDKITTKYTNRIEAENGEGQPRIKLKIKITNTTKEPYYCALLFHSQNFAIYNNFIDGQTTRLEGEAVEWAEFQGNKVITLGQEEYIQHYNWKAETSYLKLIISKKSFDIAKLGMDALPSPEIKINRGVIKRGLIENEKTNPPEWMSQLVTLELENPYFDEAKAAARRKTI